MSPTDHDNDKSPHDISRAVAERLLAYEQARAAGRHLDRPPMVEADPLDRLGANLACVDLLHRVWPDFEKPTPPPSVLGDFQLIRELGRGGMGTVFEAEQRSMGRRVALKMLPFAALANEKSLQRFRNEVRAAAALDHPHIVSVYSIGEDRGIHYFAMQLIRGQTLGDMIAQLQGDSRQDSSPMAVVGPTTPSVASLPSSTRVLRNVQVNTLASPSPGREHYRWIARLGIQAAEALQYAHDQGVLHRDVKPSNLLIDREGQLFIADFGLARLVADAGVTMTGDIVGTLRYMAPEQALAKRVVIDHRADVYSLGATLYELLALQPAFDETDRAQLLKQIAFEEPRPLRKVDRRVPVELETIAIKAMAKLPEERYQSAQRLADDLRAYLESRPIKARPASFADQARKWSRRHQTLVAVAGVAVALLSVVLAVSTILLKRAENRAVVALGESSELLYLADMTLAYQAFGNGLQNEAQAILARHLPSAQNNYRQRFEWNLLDALLAPPNCIELVGHKDAVNEICVFADGKRLASVGDDGTLRIWDISSQTVVREYKLDANPLYSIALSPDERYIVAGSDKAYLCDLKEENQVEEIFLASHNIESLAFRPDGACIAVGARYHDVFLITLKGEVIGCRPCASRVQSLEFISGERMLLVPDRTHQVPALGVAQLWSDDFSFIQHESIGGSKGPEGITIARLWPGGNYILIGERNIARAHLIHRKSGKVVSSTFGAQGNLIDLAIEPTGQAIALAYDDGNIEYIETRSVLDNITLNKRSRIFKAHQGEVASVKFLSPDRLATCGLDGVVRVWAMSGSTVQNLDLSKAYANSALLSPDGSAILYTSRDGHVIVHISDGRIMDQTTQAIAGPATTAWSPDSGRAIFCGVGTRLAIVNRKGERECFFRHHGVTRDIEFSPCGRFVGVIGEQQLQLYDAVTGNGIARPPVGVSGTAIAFTHGGDRLAYGGPSMPIVICELPGLLTEREFGSDLDTECIAFSPDDATMATGHANGLIKLWDFATGRLTAELAGHERQLQCITFTPDGRTLLSSAEDGTVRLWSVDHARSLGVLARVGHSTLRTSEWCEVSLSADGGRMAMGYHPTGGDNCDVRIWNIGSVSK